MKRKQFCAWGISCLLLVTGIGKVIPDQVVAATKISVSNAKDGRVTIRKGASLRLKAKAGGKKVTWSTSNKKIVSVTKRGTIKGRKKGKATITVSAPQKKSYRIKVTVGIPVKKVEMMRKAYVTYVGKSIALRPLVVPQNASEQTLAYRSSNPKIVTVSKKGVVKGLKEGNARIIVRSTDGTGKKVVANVKVLKNAEMVTAVDDFFQSVNADTFANAQLDPEKELWSEFDQLDKLVTKRKKDIITNTTSAYAEGSPQANIQALYTTGINVASRNAKGLNELQEILQQIDGCQTMDAFLRLQGQMSQIGYKTVLPLEVNTSLADYQNYRLYLCMPETYLSHSAFTSSWYREYTEEYKSYIQAMLMAAGENQTSAEQDAFTIFNLQSSVSIDMDSLLAGMDSMSEDELEQYLLSKTYRAYTLEQVKALFPHCDIATYLQAAGFEKVGTFMVEYPASAKAMGDIFNKGNLKGLKAWARFAVLHQYAPYLTSDIFAKYKHLEQVVNGAKTQSLEEYMESATQKALTWEVDKIYTDTYVSEQDQANVKNMAEKIRNQYAVQLSSCQWLSDATKQRALQKLNHMTINVLRPEKYEPYLLESDLTSVASGGSIVANMQKIYAEYALAERHAVGAHITGDSWLNSTTNVNAWYYAHNNSITIGAGLLGDAVYSGSRSETENYGGLGTIIGHEISHAFDAEGSKYDENGNKEDWWTEEDKVKFKAIQKRMIQYYDSFNLIEGTQNFQDGTQTLSENMADLAGVSCVVQLIEATPEARNAFFTSYGKMWAAKMSRYAIAYYAMMDEHSNNKVRVNAVLPMLPEFYETYAVSKWDAMYVAPENRIQIW